MSTHQGFLDAIRAEPDDMTHRLIFADWLEEQGTGDQDAAQAELIRVQIARLSANSADLEFWKLRARERVLLQRWLPVLTADLPPEVEDIRFHRGMIEALALPVEPFVREYRTLRERIPLQGVALGGYGELLNPEMLAPFVGLRIWNVLCRVENADWQREFGPVLRPRQVDLSALWLDFLQAGLEFGWPLRHLGLGTVRLPRPGGELDVTLTFDDESLSPLLRGPIPKSLCSLDLRGVVLERDGWEWFFDFAFFQQIERLAFWADPGQGDAFDLLSHQENLTQLRSLWLGGAPGERFRLPGEALRGLNHLVVQGDDWFDPSRNHQPTEMVFPELRTLRQEYLRDGGDLVQRLMHDEDWPALRVLELRRWQSNFAEAIPHLLQSRVIPRLRRLELPALPERGFDAALGPHALNELTLTATDLSTSIAAVSRAGELPGLVSLEIARARLDRPSDLEPLLDRDRFPHLTRLEIGGLELSPEWAERFRERFGDGANFEPHPRTVFPVHDHILEGWL